jgi:2-methylcitrate dehydratase PrpD
MLLDDLAARALLVKLDQCPAEALETARWAILDTVGVTLAGAATATTATIWQAVRPSVGTGKALLFGGRRHVDALNAAIVNGTASHALDFDDCSNTLGGHPSAPILPALWALAETRGASGADLLVAYVTGFEVQSAIARAVNFDHYEKGWHPTATLGTFGSAAACGRLLGLDREQMVTALALAASMASGIKANFGTMTKPFHVGHCSRNGLFAASLAAEGMTANPEALEHPQGFFAVFDGMDRVHPARMLEHWGEPLDLVEPGIAFKRHPCCGSTHPAIDALLQLRAEHELCADAVASVESWTHPRRFRHTNRPDPRSGLDGKFSIQYVLARALMHGLVSLDHFTEEAVRDPAARTVMARIHSAADPAARMDSDEHFYARVRVVTQTNKTYEAFVDRPLGRDRNHPLPEGTLETKFHDCAGQVITADAAKAIVERILAIEEVGDVRSLSALLAEGALDNELPGLSPLTRRSPKVA